MTSDRDDLIARLERHYRSQGWSSEHVEDGTLRANGPGGVTWIGATVLDDDLSSERLPAKLVELSEQRMPDGGELCPLDLLAPPECESELRSLLDRIGLSRRPHVSVYSLAA